VLITIPDKKREETIASSLAYQPIKLFLLSRLFCSCHGFIPFERVTFEKNNFGKLFFQQMKFFI